MIVYYFNNISVYSVIMSATASAMTVVATVFVSLLSSRLSDGARLLIISDAMSSHVMQFSRLGLELAKLGHDVRVLVPSNARIPNSVRQQQQLDEVDSGSIDDKTGSSGKFELTTYPAGDETPYFNSLEFGNTVLEVALTKSFIGKLRLLYTFVGKFFDILVTDGRRLIENQEVMEDLRNGGYQFVILEPASMAYAVPLTLGIPYALMGVCFTPAHSYRVPRLASFSATPSLDYGDRMTFTQRLTNFVFMITASLTDPFRRLEIPADRLHGNTSAITVLEAIRRSSLWLMVEDSAVGYATPHMPNTIPVGDVMTGRPGLPLPADLEKFVAASTDGVIVVSFGSYLDNVPDYVVDKFCDAFRRLRSGLHVVWKLRKSHSCSDATNVKTLPWIPQNDLLADDRVRLFVSHGGLNGLMETIYHAKPVIVFPLYSDQPANAAAVASKGFAIRMDIGDFTADSLLANMEEILTNRSYDEKVRLWSSIVRDRPDTAAERVSNMVDHVIKYGDEHLRTGAFEMSLLEFLMFDVFAVFYLAGMTCVVTSYFSLRCLWKRLRCRQQSRSAKRRKTKAH
jgi:2-hydroxyacylsphingosine 1-beta-galactosyltransferase